MVRIGRVSIFSPELLTLLFLEGLLSLIALFYSEMWSTVAALGLMIVGLVCLAVIAHGVLRIANRGGFVFYNPFRRTWLLKITFASFHKLPTPLI